MAEYKNDEPCEYIYDVVAVTKIVDGDTLDCVFDLGFDVRFESRVRLLGIDTPESRTRDLKFQNFLIGEHNKLTLVGIDAFGWSSLKEVSSLRAWKYKDQKLDGDLKVKGSPYLDYSDAVQ